MAGNFTPAGIEYLVKNFSKGMSDLGKLDKAQQNLGKSATDVGKQFTGLGKGILSTGAKAGGAALAGVTALGAGVAALGVVSVKTAISFESAFTGVLKTTDGLTDSVGNLNIAGMELREGFVDLSKEVPLAFEELAAIGELGGQLGIGRDALLEFTESVAALGVSTNLSTEEAASGLARMSNIFNVSAEDMGGNISQLGSSIVDLGNNFATTERDILAFAERLAGAGAISGLTQADVLGIGAAMSSVGVQAEAGGTAVQKVLLAINNAVVGTTTGFVDNTEAIDENINRLTSLNGKLVALESKAGLTGQQILQMRDEFISAGGSAEEFGRQLGATERRQLFETALAVQDLTEETQLLRELQGTPIDAGQLEKFASVAGLAATEFEELWKEDASQAFQLFVEGLGKQGDEAINTLDELGLTDQRLIRAFLSLSGAGDLLERTLDTANGAFEENTALADEAAKRYATTESQLLIFKNTIRAVGDAIGSRFLPFLNRLITAGKNLVNKFADPVAQAIDEKIIPAIEGVIALGSELFAAFQAGGTAGLVDALGLTPETVELISKISQSIQDLGTAIIGFFLPGIQQLGEGGVLDAINAAIIFLNENFEALKGAVIGVGAALAGAAIVAILGTIGSIIAAIVSPVVLVVAAAAALGAAWATNWLGIRDTVISTWEKLQPIFQTIIEWFETNIPVAVQALSDVWTNNLLPAFSEVGRAIQENIFPLFNQLMELLRSEGPGAVQVMSDIWDGILLPALRAVGNFILNTLIPTWTRIIVLFIEEIPAGINRMVTVWNFLRANFNNISSFITGTLIPTFSNLITWVRDTMSEAVNTAISLWNLFLVPVQAVADFLNANVMPVIQSVANFLDAVLGVALTAVAGLWENVFLPALQTVWDFINASILPIFQTVSDTGEATVGLVAQTVADIWNNILLPAFEAVWNFINESILPVFSTLADIINTVVIVAIDTLSSTVVSFVDTALLGLQAGLDGIKTVLSEVTGFFDSMTESVLNFQLPEVLQPGSPTPFEMGLIGVSTALDTLNSAFISTFQDAGGLAQQLSTSLVTINEQMAVILPETLAILFEAFSITFEQIILILIRALGTLDKVNLLIIEISTVSLPQLANSARVTVQAIIAGFQLVNKILAKTDLLVKNIADSMKELAKASNIAARAMTKGFERAANSIRRHLLPAISEAIRLLNSQAKAAERAALAAGRTPQMGNATANLGVGFQAGTPNNVGGALGLGFRVPSGFPNDTFPMRVTSGEEVLVSPRGTSIENLIFSRLADLGGRSEVVTNNNFNFEMTVNTGASPQSVIQQFDVMRGLIGA